jgi:hypothetical protein
MKKVQELFMESGARACNQPEVGRGEGVPDTVSLEIASAEHPGGQGQDD